MKVNIRSFISGCIVTATVAGLIGTAAATIGKKTATLDYNDIKVTLNGQQVNMVNANGGAVEPFAINGTTYLPVRAIADALGLEVEWDQETTTVILEGEPIENPVSSGTMCYTAFSVPMLDNVVGFDSLVEVYVLEAGDSVAYYYDSSRIKNNNYLAEYEELLESYGFTKGQSISGNDILYENAISGTAVDITPNFYGEIIVLIMAPNGTNSTGNYPYYGDDVTHETVGVDFPLHLYSNDGKVYLGKLVTSTYDSDGIWNPYGSYGSEYSRNSIWNQYGDYGSAYSSESAFNEYATKPPIIVDDSGKFFGYLTTNEYTKNSYTIYEIQQYLLNNGQ